VVALPAAWYLALHASRRSVHWLLAACIGLMTCAVTLTRTRSAWWAGGISAAVFLLSPRAYGGRLRANGSRRQRIGVIAGCTLGVAAAIVLPNRLGWRSGAPYQETLRRLIDVRNGSGAGRLRQYRQTLRMVEAHPWFGVGIGNWSVDYPAFLDPQIDPEFRTYRGRPHDRMATSDAVTIAAEGGLTAVVLALVFAGVTLARPAARLATNRVARPDLEAHLRWAGAVSTLAAALTLAAVDNLILVQPTAFVFAAALAWFTSTPRPNMEDSGGARRHWYWVALAVVVGGTCVVRLALQNLAAWAYASGVSTERLEQLAFLDRGEYWLHIQLAFDWSDRGECDRAGVHARLAATLYPNVAEPRTVEASCVVPRPGATVLPPHEVEAAGTRGDTYVGSK